MNKYYKILLSFSISLLIFLIITIFISTLNLNYHFIDKAKDKNYLLYKYQIKKIENYKINKSNLIFLGDSSLGNSIDSNLFNKLSGYKSINFALNEAYGFAGQLNLLRDILKVHKPKKIILFNSINFLKKNTENEAYHLTSSSFFDIKNAFDKISFIKFYYTYIVKYLIVKLEFNMTDYQNFYNQSISFDYIKQSNKKPKKIVKQISGIQSNFESQHHYLKLIEKLCKKEKIEIIQIYGPISENFLQYANFLVLENDKFYSKFDYLFRIKKQITINDNEIGDDYMHVRYDKKIFFTEKFYEILKVKL
tara:strand:- start:5693 stop:6613 length:921 start_codon:yes stop_codon:yes gene_type:complete